MLLNFNFIINLQSTIKIFYNENHQENFCSLRYNDMNHIPFMSFKYNLSLKMFIKKPSEWNSLSWYF